MSGDATEKPRRLTLSDLVEKQLAALSRTTSDHSSVTLTRNARGDTQIAVVIRTGENGIETPDAAAAAAHELYDSLCADYPMKPRSVGPTDE